MSEIQTPDPQGQPGEPAEPKLYAGKYKSVEDLEKGYKSLESKLGSKPSVEIEREPESSRVLEVEDALSQAGFSYEDIEASVSRNGKPTEAQYKALAKAGMSRSAVDRSIRAEFILRDSTTRAAIEAAGGREQIDALREWAASKDSGLTDAEIDAFNKAVGRGSSPDAAKSQVEYLMFKAQKAGVTFGESESKGIIGGSPTSGSSGGFKSYDELGKAYMAVCEGKMTQEEFNRRERATPASVKTQPGVRSR